MESITEAKVSRRWTGRFIRLGLVLLAVFIAGSWMVRKVSRARAPNVRVVNTPPIPDAALAPGDMRLYNRDSTVDLILRGSQVLAGLSPKTVERVRSEMQKSSQGETTGLGGFIASTVKSTVANSIGIHAAYSVHDIRDMRYQDGQLVIERTDGGETHLFGETKVDRREVSKTFDEEDAQRFIEAVRQRKRELGNPPSSVIIRRSP